MCTEDDFTLGASGVAVDIADTGSSEGELLEFARQVVAAPEVRRSAAGFIGFGAPTPGARVLIGVDSHYQPRVVNAFVEALRERGASVDVITTDAGPDREFDELDEIRAIIRRRPFIEEPRRWEGKRWIEELALQQGYSLLILGKGGGPPPANGPYPTPERYEGIPWLMGEHLASQATTYPREVHAAMNQNVWSFFTDRAKGGQVHLTDPEGTDLTWTLTQEHWEGPGVFARTKVPWGHLHSHGTTPVSSNSDGEGVVAGTTNHFSKPFPKVTLTVAGGKVRSIEGGGEYGRGWQEVLDETVGVQYPVFPEPGLFWMVEAAIGTNPKVRRTPNVRMVSSGGLEWERRRSGVIHLGFGTFWRDIGEEWAGERGIVYGHLHVHQLFPTLDVTTTGGETVRIIDHGHLTALDDPDIRKLAERYGDPDDLLKEDWIPAVPGITAPGSYADYAQDPAGWIYQELDVGSR